MDRFVANFTLRLDSKGRVSIPASFRSVLGRDGFEGLYCYPALDRPAIDAGGNALMLEIEALIGRYAPFSDQREQFALALYGTSETLKIDGEGRVVLEREPQASCGNYRGGGVCWSRSQVSDLGARQVPERARGGHPKGARAQRELSSQVAARNALGARE